MFALPTRVRSAASSIRIDAISVQCQQENKHLLLHHYRCLSCRLRASVSQAINDIELLGLWLRKWRTVIRCLIVSVQQACLRWRPADWNTGTAEPACTHHYLCTASPLLNADSIHNIVLINYRRMWSQRAFRKPMVLSPCKNGMTPLQSLPELRDWCQCRRSAGINWKS